MTEQNMLQKQYWEEEKRRRSPTHPVVEAFVEPKLDYIMNNITLADNSIILDIGCGNGFFTYYFSKMHKTIGLDFSRYMLSINSNESLVQGSTLLLPFKDRQFDLVFCSNLLHHLEKPEMAVSEMERVSKQYVVISEPNRNNPLMFLFSLFVKEEHNALKYSLEFIEKLLNKNYRLNIIDSKSLGSIVPNKTPLFLLDLVKLIDHASPFGFFNMIITEKLDRTNK